MNKTIKKIVIVIAVFLLAVLAKNSTSFAMVWGWSNFNHMPYGFYCVQKGQPLSAGQSLYEYKTFHIKGWESKSGGETVSVAKQNAVFAYILNVNDGGASTYFQPSAYTAKQCAIWGYFGTWKNVNGLNGYSSNSEGYSSAELVAKGKSYAETVKDEVKATITDKTDYSDDKLKKDFYTYKNTDYIKIGPFKWTYDQDLESIKVYDQNGKKINVLYGKYNSSNNFKVYDDFKNVAVSGKNFYILVKGDGSVTKINKIVANVVKKQTIITADVTLWSSRSGAQHVISESTGTEETKSEVELTTPEIELFINLSGYVWIDKGDGKRTVRNDLYANSTLDTQDVAFNNIKVMLKDKNGNTVKETRTSEQGLYSEINGGEYIFEKVPLAKISEYYVEFEYDGLTYTNVASAISKDNGSKAAETVKNRSDFNANFTTIEKDSTTKDGKVVYGSDYISYTRDTSPNAMASIFDHKKEFPITAQTTTTGFSLKAAYLAYVARSDIKEADKDTLKFINLGLYERSQPDISLQEDIQNAVITINGNTHVYNYGKRLTMEDVTYVEGLNVGVKFANTRGTAAYTRAIYKSDIEYQSTDKTRELQIEITYKIDVTNESGDAALYTKVNSIANYFDSNYTFVAAGTGLDANGSITNPITATVDESYNQNGYKKLMIQTTATTSATEDVSNDTINNGTVTSANAAQTSATAAYVRFKMSRETVAGLFSEDAEQGVPLKSVAEINSYSVYTKNSKGNMEVYAGIDKDSAPANAVPGDKNTYEDDTDDAPAFKLEAVNTRVITGNTFVDTPASNSIVTGEQRRGNDTYGSEDTALPNVEVTMAETTGATFENGDTVTYKTTSNDAGEFTIDKFIPGNYIITYTWGDETYTVQQYKSVVFHSDAHQGLEWYKSTDPRYSDAIDNWEQRVKIDDEIGSMEDATDLNGTLATTITKLDASTLDMKFGVELESVISDFDDTFAFNVPNLDFGIIERARQAINADKSVTQLRVNLADGTDFITTNISKNDSGYTMDNPSNYLKIVGDQVVVEMDNELMQGATLRIGYTLKVSNLSELDYNDENFYKYGTIPANNASLIKITPTGVYDFLESQDMLIDENETSSTGWTEVTLDQYNEKNPVFTLEESKTMTETVTVADDGTVTVMVKSTEDANSSEKTYADWFTQTTLTERKNALQDKTIMSNPELYKEMAPGETNTVEFDTTKLLANSDDEINLNNTFEVTKISKNGGSIINNNDSKYHAEAEEVIVIPPTGDNQNYLIYGALGIIVLIVLGVGVFVIKKKAL